MYCVQGVVYRTLRLNVGGNVGVFFVTQNCLIKKFLLGNLKQKVVEMKSTSPLTLCFITNERYYTKTKLSYVVTSRRSLWLWKLACVTPR